MSDTGGHAYDDPDSPSLTDEALTQNVRSALETQLGRYGRPKHQGDATDWRTHGNVAIGGPIERRKANTAELLHPVEDPTCLDAALTMEDRS